MMLQFWSMLGMKYECVKLKYKVTGVILSLNCSGGRNNSGAVGTKKNYGVIEIRDAIPSSKYQGFSTTRQSCCIL